MNTDKFRAELNQAPNRLGYVHVGHRDIKSELVEAIGRLFAEVENKAQVVLDVPAFTDEMSKAEMIDHLIEYHNLKGWDIRVGSWQSSALGVNTKATKADLVKLHDRVHLAQSDPNAEITLEGIQYDHGHGSGRSEVVGAKFHLGGYPMPEVFHNHNAPIVAEAVTTGASAAREGKRVPGELSVQQRKALEQVVNNDFNTLKQDMRTFASDALANAVAEINADWDEKERKIPDFASRATQERRSYEAKFQKAKAEYEAKVQAMKDDHRAKFGAIRDEAAGQGVVLEEAQEEYLDAENNKRTRPVYKAKVQGRQEAIGVATQQNKADLDRALLTLEKQRLAAQRQVLLAGVPEGAAKTLLDSIPSAQELMVEAYKKDAPKQIDSNAS